MKQAVLLSLTLLLFSGVLKSQPKLSHRQQKLAAYIKDYQDAIANAPDSSSKIKRYYELWKKHMIFIQDSLKFSTYPVYALDTFYFEKAFVQPKADNKKYIEVLLENESYVAITAFDLTKVSNLRSVPIYRMLTNLNQNSPVLAVIHLQDLSLSSSNISQGSKTIILTVDLRAIYNVQ